MTDRGRVTTPNGLRLRDSPRDGDTLEIIPQHAEVEILGRETWLRVNYGGTVGFVLADYVEPEDSMPAPTDVVVRIVEVSHKALEGETLRADEEFAQKVLRFAERAGELDIALWVTSSLREPYQPVRNAVVTPADFSNHHVGHAFDMNIRFQGRLYGSAELGNAQDLPVAVNSFLRNEVETFGLVWGGKWTPPDPVHIDDRLNVDRKTDFQTKLLALWGPPPMTV
jgi:hypothetical protein